jgi:hypothetical protein
MTTHGGHENPFAISTAFDSWVVPVSVITVDPVLGQEFFILKTAVESPE